MSQNALGTYKHNLCSIGLRNFGTFSSTAPLRTYPSWPHPWLISHADLSFGCSTLYFSTVPRGNTGWVQVFFFPSLFLAKEEICYFMCFWYPGPFFLLFILFFFFTVTPHNLVYFYFYIKFNSYFSLSLSN